MIMLTYTEKSYDQMMRAPEARAKINKIDSLIMVVKPCRPIWPPLSDVWRPNDIFGGHLSIGRRYVRPWESKEYSWQHNGHENEDANNKGDRDATNKDTEPGMKNNQNNVKVWPSS